MIGSVYRLEWLKEVVGGHIVRELGSHCTLNKLGQVSEVGDRAVVFKGLRV